MPCCILIAQATNSLLPHTMVDEKLCNATCIGDSSIQIRGFFIKIYIDANGKGEQAPWQAEEALLVENVG
jgi:hypothetical protein